ncbi:MAG: tRNA-intron lyase [Euryarchaeota archaeon]|nr:tRNA-intron lyase [Euryarchaeota archaeon]
MVQVSLLSNKVVLSGEQCKKIWRLTGFGLLENGKLVLSPEETIALYLMGRIKLKKNVLNEIWDKTSENPNTFKRILALIDLIGRRTYKGHVGPEPYDISLWKKSEKPGAGVPKIRIKLYSDYEDINVGELLYFLNSALYNKKQFLIGIVDEEGEIVYYAVKKVDPRGGMSEIPEGTFEGKFIGDRMIVTQPCKELEETFFGKRLFGMLILSPLETEFLRENSIITTDHQKIMDTILRRLHMYDKSIVAKYLVYKDLKLRGHVVKSGFKYGAHFRVYKDNPNETHSNYLVNVVTSKDNLRPYAISSMVRLAHSVNKKLLLAVTSLEDEKVDYISVEYIKP